MFQNVYCTHHFVCFYIIWRIFSNFVFLKNALLLKKYYQILYYFLLHLNNYSRSNYFAINSFIRVNSFLILLIMFFRFKLKFLSIHISISFYILYFSNITPWGEFNVIQNLRYHISGLRSSIRIEIHAFKLSYFSLSYSSRVLHIFLGCNRGNFMSTRHDKLLTLFQKILLFSVSYK